jgi:hypothetical protein
MRTTVDIPEHLLVEVKKLAASRRSSLTRIVEESLRIYLADARAKARKGTPPPRLPVARDARLVRGVDLDDTSALWEVE